MYEDIITVWHVYKKGRPPYKGLYTARQFIIHQTKIIPTYKVLMYDDLKTLRETLKQLGFIGPISPKNDKNILEIWSRGHDESELVFD